jgi:hypothetical protein
MKVEKKINSVYIHFFYDNLSHSCFRSRSSTTINQKERERERERNVMAIDFPMTH